MTVPPELLALTSAHEQDEARGRTWWREATLADKLLVFACIVREYDDPVMDVMSRFAQLAFIRMILDDAKEGP